MTVAYCICSHNSTVYAAIVVVAVKISANTPTLLYTVPVREETLNGHKLFTPIVEWKLFTAGLSLLSRYL